MIDGFACQSTSQKPSGKKGIPIGVDRRELWRSLTGVVALVGVWQLLYGFGLLP